MEDKKQKVLSWDAFQSLGNPENAPEIIEDKKTTFKSPLKVHYEKKGRGGKEALIIKGFDVNENHDLDAISKLLKSKLGVGGSVKENEIVIQGNQRDKVCDILKGLGFNNVKKAGG